MQKYYFKILKKNSYKYSILSMLLVLYSCSAIEATDISNNEINTIIPIEESILTSNIVNFKWSVIENADEYHIQVVSPSFDNSLEFALDSIISETSINFSLNPNQYQWRVKALNNISETNYSSPINFQVDEVVQLTDQTVILNFPDDEVYLNSIQNNFTWENLAHSDYYLYQLVKGNEFSNDVIEQNTTENNFYLLNTSQLDDDVYTWKVKGINSFSETPFSFRKFFFDTVIPNTPILLSPNDNETSTSDVTFKWNLGVDQGNIHSPVTSVIEVSISSDFNTLFDSINVSNNEIDFSFSTTGVFYWRVKAFDEAGNISFYSNPRIITIE